MISCTALTNSMKNLSSTQVKYYILTVSTELLWISSWPPAEATAWLPWERRKIPNLWCFLVARSGTWHEQLSILPSSLPPSQSTNTVYFVSGLPDTTLKLKKKFHMNGRKRFYEEVINSTAKNFHTHVLKIIKAAEKSIKNANAIPIFSTICPMSIRTWNRQIIPPPHIIPEPQNMTICNQFLKKLSPSSTHPSLASIVKTKSPPLKYASPSCTSVKDISAADMANSLMEYTPSPK